MIESPATRPARDAGESACTAGTVTPTNGVASQAIAVKIANASRRFIRTPATRIQSLTPNRCAENECGSSAASPSSPSSFTKPPMGSQLSV